MHKLLQSNVQRANDRVKDFPLFEINPDGFAMRPVFGEPPLRCLRDQYFGFYVVPNAAAGLLRSVNFLVASDSALVQRLHAPSIAMSYTASYHVLSAFLALNGRLWIDKPWFERRHENDKQSDSRIDSAGDGTRVVVARLTKGNSWIYEKGRRSHKARWRDLVSLFTPSDFKIPSSLQELFGYIYRGRHKPCPDLLELLRNREKYRYQIREVLQAFLDEISDTRHVSLYRGFGSDPAVWEALVNRDTHDASLLDLQARAFRDFAFRFASEVSQELHSLLRTLSLPSSLAEKIGLRVYLAEYLDEPEVGLVADTKIQQHCADIRGMLDPRTGA